MESTNTSLKRQKKFPLQAFDWTEVQGDLLQRPSRDQNQL